MSLSKALRLPWKGKRYAVVDGKENEGCNATPKSKRNKEQESVTVRPLLENGNRPMHLRRSTSLTGSVRDALGTIRQKLRKSTRQRKRLQNDLKFTPSRRSNRATSRTPTRGDYRDVKMYSPFTIDTPEKNIKPGRMKTCPQWYDMETPSRLKREVEDLTANMQALVSLTPGTLQSRSHRRHSSMSPITNGSLRTCTLKPSATSQVRRKISTVIN
ncbi:hypothetical protein CHS0354_031607 [Potamilus streckersoni]|uniref:Uncharacterized protein n=1 Tax=Potamilus streckersoni TaxID=2493646 RepID=A0AAE0SG95_9BIVA|nr:hypothetical protein CHS0354_031607 [Potamilus streckersoni]